MEKSKTWVLGSTNVEFHTEFKNDLSFYILGPWKPQEAFYVREIIFLHVCDQPTGSTGLPGSPGIFVRQASGASGLVAKVQNSNFPISKYLLHLPGCQNQKTNVIFVITIRFCISGCLNLNFDFFCKCYTEMPRVRPLPGFTF